MTTDFRALCAELVMSWDVDGCDWKPRHQAAWNATVERARAALAEPEPPADGEVAELVAELIRTANYLDDDWYHGSARVARRAADLLERLASPACVVLKPSPELIAAFKAAGYGRIESMERLAPQPQPEGPSDEELLELMPQQFRDDLATVSRLAAHGTSPDVTPGIFRVSLNTGALDYARAVLARWGRQPAQDASAPCPPGG